MKDSSNKSNKRTAKAIATKISPANRNDKSNAQPDPTDRSVKHRSKKRAKVSIGTASSTREQPVGAATAAPIRIATATNTSSSALSSERQNPFLVSFPGGLPQGLLSLPSNKRQHAGPVFSWRSEGGSASSSSAAINSRKNSAVAAAAAASKRFRLVGKDATCMYRSEVTVASTTTTATNEDRNNNKKNATPSAKANASSSTTSSSTARSNYSQWCVGLYDKRRQVLTLYPTAPDGQIFTMQQSVPTYRPVISNNETSNQLLTSVMDRRRLLTQDFGSAKQKKVMQSLQDNMVNVDTVVGGSQILQQILPADDDEDDDNINNNVMKMSESNRRAMQQQRNQDPNTAAQDALEEGYDQVRRLYLPPFDKDAKEPLSVYRARDMVGDDEEAWSMISRVVDACRKQEDVITALTQPPPPKRKQGDQGELDDEREMKKRASKVTPWNACVLAALRHLSLSCNLSIKTNATTTTSTPTTTNNSDAFDVPKYQLQCALLLNHLINFYRRHATRKFIRESKADSLLWWECRTPQILARRFLSTFCVVHQQERGDGGNVNRSPLYVMPQAKRDQCMVHILLLYMIVRGGAAMKVNNLLPIVQDLNTDVVTATKLLRLAGCTILQQPGGSGGRSSSAVTVQLKVPLTFAPPPERKRRRMA